MYGAFCLIQMVQTIPGSYLEQLVGVLEVMVEPLRFVVICWPLSVRLNNKTVCWLATHIIDLVRTHQYVHANLHTKPTNACESSLGNLERLSCLRIISALEFP